MENFESLRREKRRRKALLKLFGLDGFDVDNCSYPSRLIKSTWGRSLW
ncbi:unnamed protein product [Brassica oleracea var. botrytis]|uniref:(rape) hypothetical protein n=1 Tax=Brassica napus TaxID=3708 RepID=A0A816RC09_BRANA|nr:unnamed protein product [Brassica napus]